jgi:phospholipid-translocating ATPase
VQRPKNKVSRIEKKVNYIVIAMLLILLGMVVLSLILSEVNSVSEIQATTFENIILFILLYNSIIPISLFVVMDLVRILQMYFIQKDMAMYNPKTNKRTTANIGDINEDLGQVEYVFADKNGAFATSNLWLKACYIGETFYGKMGTNMSVQGE